MSTFCILVMAQRKRKKTKKRRLLANGQLKVLGTLVNYADNTMILLLTLPSMQNNSLKKGIPKDIRR